MFLGQYVQGDEVIIRHRAYAETPDDAELDFDDASPKVAVYRTNSSVELIQAARMMAAYEHPAVPGNFRLSIRLGSQYSVAGYYVAVVTWHHATGDNQLIVRHYPFEILPGGDQNGTLTSMAEISRPDKRFLVCGTSFGRIVRRKNPRVNQ